MIQTTTLVTAIWNVIAREIKKKKTDELEECDKKRKSEKQSNLISQWCSIFIDIKHITTFNTNVSFLDGIGWKQHFGFAED